MEKEQYSENDKAIQKKIKLRGEINLIASENFIKKYGLKYDDKYINYKPYKNEEDIINIYEKNIGDNKYFNLIFLEHDNKEDGFKFLETFIDTNKKNKIAKNNSDYPFFVFFESKFFNKEMLYLYYLENTKKKKISRFYDIKSHNIYFINSQKEEIEKLITTDIFNYYYELDNKNDENHNFGFKIEMLFMGQTGCGKSTFINYMLGKLRAFSTSANFLKSLGGTYTHTIYPIIIKDSEGFELNSFQQEDKIFKLIEKNIDDELNERTHIAFYLIPGPFNSNRDLDYSYIKSLIKLEQFNIHYYLIMTKDPEEDDMFSTFALRFIRLIIKNKDFEKINSDLPEKQLMELLRKVEKKLEFRIFSVDISKRESESVGNLLNQINEDLKTEKKNVEKFLDFLINLQKKGSNIQIDFSGSEILNGEEKFEFPPELKNSPFFSLKKFENDENRKKKAQKIIKEAQDVSSIRKLFLCYNSRIKENRKNMMKEILSIYNCENLTIDLLEDKLSDEEQNQWFYQHDCTDALGDKIIKICEEQYKKNDAIKRYIPYCREVVKSIDKFGEYVEDFVNFNLNGIKIPYDCELKVK